MHTLFGVSTVLLVLASGYLTLRVLPGLGGWAERRDLQFFILAAPIISLALAIAGLMHFSGLLCFLEAPPWDYSVGVALPLAMALAALAGLGLGLLRLALLDAAVVRGAERAGAHLQALADHLAARCGGPSPRLLIRAFDRPLALTVGLWRPRVVLSTWMLKRLDAGELESVLAHEVAHVARRDFLVTWLATVLRDAFFYLPTSWAAYRQLQHEKELACDDLAVAVTKRPLALASALAKVWQPTAAVSGLRRPSLWPPGTPSSAGSSGF